ARRHPHFPRPLVGRAGDVLFSYVPIEFRDRCRIVVEGPAAALRQAQVSGLTLPDAAAITPFREELSPVERSQLERAVAGWSRPQDLIAADQWHGHPAHGDSPAGLEARATRLAVETSAYAVDGIARNTHRFLMPAGPRT